MAALEDFLLQEDDIMSLFMEQLQTTSGHPFCSLIAYVAYHIWLTRNALIFTQSRCTASIIMERAHAHTKEYVLSIVSTSETWGFSNARRAPRQIFIS